jgi:hypothetical protein
MRIRLARQFAVLLIASSVAFSARAGAQDTGATSGSGPRAQAVADAEQEKAKHLEPQVPPRGERKFDHIQKALSSARLTRTGPASNLAEYPREADSRSDRNIPGRICWQTI